MYMCNWVIFSCFLSSGYFFKIYFFLKFFQGYHQCQTVWTKTKRQARSGSKLFAKVISRQHEEAKTQFEWRLLEGKKWHSLICFIPGGCLLIIFLLVYEIRPEVIKLILLN